MTDMIQIFGLACMTFVQFLMFLIIFEVISSWLMLLGIYVYIKPIKMITRPMFDIVQKYFPTKFGMLDFTPLILLLILHVMLVGLQIIFPSVSPIF